MNSYPQSYPQVPTPFGAVCQVATHLQLNTFIDFFFICIDEMYKQRLQAKVFISIIVLLNKLSTLKLLL